MSKKWLSSTMYVWHLGMFLDLWGVEPSISDWGIPRVDLKIGIVPYTARWNRENMGKHGKWNVATYIHSRFFKRKSLLYAMSQYTHTTINTSRTHGHWCFYSHLYLSTISQRSVQHRGQCEPVYTKSAKKGFCTSSSVQFPSNSIILSVIFWDE